MLMHRWLLLLLVILSCKFHNPSIYLVGDSITSRPSGWGEKLQEALQYNYSVTNGALPGSTWVDWSSWWDYEFMPGGGTWGASWPGVDLTLEPFQQSPPEPDLIVIQLGVNDAVGAFNLKPTGVGLWAFAPSEFYLVSLDVLDRYLRVSTGHILVVPPWVPVTPAWQNPAVLSLQPARDRIAGYQTQLEAFCQDPMLACQEADIWYPAHAPRDCSSWEKRLHCSAPPILQPEHYTAPDTVHPNELGAQELLDQLRSTITERANAAWVDRYWPN